MKIKRIISQHRRDFRALYACGHCGHPRALAPNYPAGQVVQP